MVTWRAAIPLAVAAVLTATVHGPWWTLAGVLASVGLVLIDAGLAGPLRGLSLDRDGDRQIRLGETATVTLTVTNHGDRHVRGVLRDAWVPSAGARPQLHRLDVAPGASVRLVATLTPTRRGDRRAVRVTVRSHGPFRFAYRQTTVRRSNELTPEWTVRVLPRFSSRRLLPEKVSRLRSLDGTVVVRGRGQGTEFDALREYVFGDDVRSIDWRATARRVDVVVRTWRPERDRRVLCVIDTGRTSAIRIGDEPRLDTYLDAALLLAALAERAGDRVDLLAIDTTVRAAVGGGSGRTLLARLVGALAPLEAAMVETDFGLVVSEVLRRERKRALVVLFTALEPGTLGEGLLPVLDRLTARHKVVLAAVHDNAIAAFGEGGQRTRPGTGIAGRGSRGGAAAVYAAAAEVRTLAERDRIAAALSRHGVEVIDAPAGMFASRVADAYLALKAAGRL